MGYEQNYDQRYEVARMGADRKWAGLGCSLPRIGKTCFNLDSAKLAPTHPQASRPHRDATRLDMHTRHLSATSGHPHTWLASISEPLEPILPSEHLAPARRRLLPRWLTRPTTAIAATATYPTFLVGKYLVGILGAANCSGIAASWVSMCGLNNLLRVLLGPFISGVVPGSNDLRVNVVAMRFTSLSVCFALFTLGIMGLFEAKDMADTPEERMGTKLPSVNTLTATMVSYQIWQIQNQIFMPTACSTLALIHHFTATATGLLVLRPYAQVYGPFFGGFTEISTVFLEFMYCFQVLPELAKARPLLEMGCKYTFAALFIFFRIFMWTPVAVRFTKDTLAVKDDYPVEVTRFMLFSIGVMTLLQYTWAGQIIAKAIAELR